LGGQKEKKRKDFRPGDWLRDPGWGSVKQSLSAFGSRKKASCNRGITPATASWTDGFSAQRRKWEEKIEEAMSAEQKPQRSPSDNMSVRVKRHKGANVHSPELGKMSSGSDGETRETWVKKRNWPSKACYVNRLGRRPQSNQEGRRKVKKRGARWGTPPLPGSSKHDGLPSHLETTPEIPCVTKPQNKKEQAPRRGKGVLKGDQNPKRSTGGTDW